MKGPALSAKGPVSHLSGMAVCWMGAGVALEGANFVFERAELVLEDREEPALVEEDAEELAKRIGALVVPRGPPDSQSTQGRKNKNTQANLEGFPCRPRADTSQAALKRERWWAR